MSGICSHHQHHEPRCNLCGKTPADLFGAESWARAEREEAGEHECTACGFVFYLTVSDCPHCGTSATKGYYEGQCSDRRARTLAKNLNFFGQVPKTDVEWEALWDTREILWELFERAPAKSTLEPSVLPDFHEPHDWVPDGINDVCARCGLPAPAGRQGITYPTSSCPGLRLGQP